MNKLPLHKTAIVNDNELFRELDMSQNALTTVNLYRLETCLITGSN